MKHSVYAFSKYFDKADPWCHKVCQNIERTFWVNTIELFVIAIPIWVVPFFGYLEMSIVLLTHRYSYDIDCYNFVGSKLADDIQKWMKYHQISWQFISYSFFDIFHVFPKKWLKHSVNTTSIRFRCEEDMMAFKLGFDIP